MVLNHSKEGEQISYRIRSSTIVYSLDIYFSVEIKYEILFSIEITDIEIDVCILSSTINY